MSENTGKKGSGWMRLFVTDADEKKPPAPVMLERDQRFTPEYERGLSKPTGLKTDTDNPDLALTSPSIGMGGEGEQAQQTQILVAQLRSKLMGFGGEALAAVEANDKALADVMPEDGPMRLRAAAAIASKEHDLADSLQKAAAQAQSEIELFNREADAALQRARIEVDTQLGAVAQERQSVHAQIEALNERLEALDAQAESHTEEAGKKALAIKKRQDAFAVAHAEVSTQIQRVQEALLKSKAPAKPNPQA